MKIKLTLTFFVLATLVAACGGGAAGTPTLPPLVTATAGAAGATATSALPAATSATGTAATTPAAPTATTSTTGVPATATAPTLPGTVQPAVSPTVLPTGTPGPLPSGDLSDNQMATILGDSLSNYPWRMDFQSADQSAGQSITGTVEANSTSRMQVTVEEPLNGAPVTVNIIVITPTIYAKVSGIPSTVLQAEGLQEGQWSKITASQDVLGLVNIASAAASPSDLVMGLGFQDLLTPSTSDQTPFKLTGTEQVAGVETNVYQRQATGSLGTTMYTVWVGASDSLVYKMQAQGPINTTLTMTYDTSINIQPPIQ